jgi:hypothetical protein
VHSKNLEKIIILIVSPSKTLGAPMAINHNLLTGQFRPLGENKIEHTLSASQKVLPTHTGKKAMRHLTPRNRKPQLENS